MDFLKPAERGCYQPDFLGKGNGIQGADPLIR